MLVMMPQRVGPIPPMNPHALPAGDETHDGIARQWIAALGSAREQIAHALNGHAGGWARCGGRARSENRPRLLERVPGEFLYRRHDLRRLDVAASGGREEIVHPVKLETAPELLVIYVAEAQTGQLALQHGRAGGE